jgi:hypothetical protein
MEPPKVQRRLTTIFSTDVQGYSRLMADDEAAVLHNKWILSEFKALKESTNQGEAFELVEILRGKAILFSGLVIRPVSTRSSFGKALHFFFVFNLTQQSSAVPPTLPPALHRAWT